MAAQAEYVAGLCNIGTAERQRRRNMGHMGVVLGGALLVGLLLVGAEPWWYLLLFLPAFTAVIGYMQAIHSFCVGYARRGLQNFGEIGDAQPVARPEDLARDRATATRLNLFAVVISAGVALVGFGVAMAFS
ncbi:MAG: hypothetical protein KIS96_04670 [Bauldia sp.]|nr:hypothetical protein [Bauldia sp.]